MAASKNQHVESYEFDSEWSKKINGFVMFRPIELGSPIVQQMTKRHYIQALKNLNFLGIFASHLLQDPEQLKQLDATLQKSANKALTNIDNSLLRIGAMITEEGIDIDCISTKIMQASAPVSCPVAVTLLDLICKADVYSQKLTAAWIQGIIPDVDKRKEDEALKKIIRTFLLTIRTLMGTTIARINDQKKKGKAVPTDVAVAVEDALLSQAEEDANDAGEGLFSHHDEKALAAATKIIDTSAPEAVLA